MDPLARLRLQLTAWYAGVLVLVLALLGTGLFLTVRRQLSRHLEVSLRAAAAALQQAARIRESERAGARGAVVDAVDELHIPTGCSICSTATLIRSSRRSSPIGSG